jgi:NADH dehydrogenase
MNLPAKKNILITGSSSYLGSSLAEQLGDSYNVSLLIHKHNNIKKKSPIKIIYGDITKPEYWSKELQKIDIVIHLAAITHSDNLQSYNNINNLGTQNILNAIKKKGAPHVIFISTRAVGSCCGAYGESKQLAEQAIKESGLPYTILRMSEVYESDFNHKEGLGNLFSLIKSSPIVPYPYGRNYTLAPLHKEDALSAIINSIENQKVLNKTYVVAGPENLTLKDIMYRICKIKGLRRFLIPVPVSILKVAFFFLYTFFRVGAPDQLKRFLCKKESMGMDIEHDLNIKPRPFLLFS